MNPNPHLLALFTASLQNPQTRDQILAETGDPNALTRHAIDVEGDDITFVFDTVDGPKPGGVELIDVAILPDSAMLVIGQRYSPQIAAKIDASKMDEIGQAIYAKYEATGGVKLSALGDPELDGKSGVFFYDRDGDGKYVVKGVGKEIQGITVNGDTALVYMGVFLVNIATVDLLGILRRSAYDEIFDMSTAVKTIGLGAKMARTAKIDIDGQGDVRVWTYVNTVRNTIHFLSSETLDVVHVQEFNGTYATPTIDGKSFVLVDRKVESGDETFPVTRVPADQFLATA